MNLKVELNSSLEGMPIYQPGRPIDEVARELGLTPESIVKLASNENPLGPSPMAINAMQEAIQDVHLYPDGNAFHLKAKLAKQLDLKPENIILGNGSNEILELAGHTLLRPGTEAIFSQYAFVVYPLVTRLFGATPVVTPARQWGHDLKAMAQAITDRTRIVFIANPNNPTGTLLPREEVIAFLHDVPSHVVVVMDEAYYEYLRHPLDLTPLLRSGDKPNLLLTRTFSKIHGLGGLRLGYGLGCPEFIAGLEKTRQPFNTNTLAQAAALAALEDNEHLEKTRLNNETGLNFLQTGLQKAGIEYVRSKANFVLVNVQQGDYVSKELLKRGVIVRPVTPYGLPEWIRLSVGRGSENEMCLAELKKVLSTMTTS